MIWQDLEQHLSAQLRSAGIAEAGLEARMMIQHILGVRGTDATEEQRALLEGWCARRMSGEPMAYILGEKGFYKWVFKVRHGVLIPRPETELIVEQALGEMAEPPKTMADLGCGSGILGICLAKEWPEVKVTAIDSSPVAIQMTIENARDLGVSEQISVQKSSVSEYLPGSFFDLVVANPPYIAEQDKRVAADVHQFEPHAALYAGPVGTELIRDWSRWAFKFLNAGGWWIFEFGAGQKEQVEEIILAMGFNKAKICKDLSGIDRVAVCQKP